MSRSYTSYICTSCRGSDFRTEYGNLSELRSILSKMNMMALTATVNETTRYAIMDSLCMEKKDTVVIEKPPDKMNITYRVCKKPDCVEIMLAPLIDEIVKLGKNTPKTIIFCKSYKDLVEIYTELVTELHNKNSLHIEYGNRSVSVCAMYSASLYRRYCKKFHLTGIRTP